ncbi:reverse transcriptase domain-containing protein [Tanacetum coccineum]
MLLFKKLPDKAREIRVNFLNSLWNFGNGVCYGLGQSWCGAYNLLPLSILEKNFFAELSPTRMDFRVVDFEADPRVPLILGRSFLRTSRTLIDVYDGKLILRDGDEQIILHVDGISNQPQKHAKESINMIGDNNGEEKQEVKNIEKPTRQSRFTPCLKIFKVVTNKSIILSNKSPQISSICAITSIFPSIEPKDSFIMGETQPTTYRVEEIVPNPKESKDTFKENDSSFCETSDSLLEEFADELALLAPFPPRNEDFDFKADLRELEMLLNQDPTTNFSPESTIDP